MGNNSRTAYRQKAAVAGREAAAVALASAAVLMRSSFRLARGAAKNFRGLSKFQKAAVVCCGVTGALVAGDQIYGASLLRRLDPSILAPLSYDNNIAAKRLHEYCDPQPQICIDNVKEAEKIVAFYVDQKGKDRDWFHKYIWNDDAAQRRRLNSYIVGFWSLEGSLSKNPDHGDSQYQGPLQFSQNRNSSYIWHPKILGQLLPLLNAIKSDDFVKQNYPALAALDTVTEKSLDDEAVFKALPVQELAALLGIDQAAARIAASPHASSFSEAETDSLGYLKHNLPAAAEVIISAPDSDCSMASLDPIHAGMYRANSGVYGSGRAWPRDVLYRVGVFMNAAREQYDPQGAFARRSPPIRFRDRSFLTRGLSWILPAKPCTAPPPTRLLRRHDLTVQAPSSPAPSAPPLSPCAQTNEAYAVMSVGEAGALKDLLPPFCADEPRIPASLTKLMTIAVALDAVHEGKIKLSTPIKMSAYAASRAPSKLGMKVGQTLTLGEALKAVVVKSANDVAVAIAEAVGGDEEKFVARMNAKAWSLGMTHTVFGNASGLPGTNRSTAHDIAKLLEAVMDYKEYTRIARLPRVSIRGRLIHGHNPLLAGKPDKGSETCLTSLPSVDGGKTGYTFESGANNALHFKLPHGNGLIIVYMGGETALGRDLEIIKLLQQAKDSGSEIMKAVPPVAMPQIAYNGDRPRCVSPARAGRGPR